MDGTPGRGCDRGSLLWKKGCPPVKGERFKTRVEERVTAFDEEEWDRILDGDDLQATHRFVRACQSSGVESARYAHVLLTDEKGPAALASLSAFNVFLDLLAPAWTRDVCGRIRDWAPRFMRFPLVVGGLPVSFNQSCLRARTDVDPEAVLTRIHPVVEDLSASTGASLVCFKEFSDQELLFALPLEGLGFTRCASLPSCSLSLPFHSFRDYEKAMRSGYRRQLRASYPPREEDDLVLRMDHLTPHVSRVFPLYEQVMDRAEYRLEHLNEAFLRALAEELSGETRVLLLEEAEGRLLAAAVLLRGSKKTTFLITGMDYDRCRRVRGYERLVTGVIEQAIRWGAGSVELGQTSWALKGRLGAQPQPRHLFFRYRKPVGNTILRHALPHLFPERPLPARRVFRHAG